MLEAAKQINPDNCSHEKFIEDYDLGQIICIGCGLVLKEKMEDTGYERRAFTTEERAERNRSGLPATYRLADKGLPTLIDNSMRDIYGKNLSLERRAEVYKMQKWQRRSKGDNRYRNLTDALPELDRLASQLKIPELVIEKAATLYTQALDRGFVRGREIRKTAAAVLYAECRLSEIERTLKDFSKYLRFRQVDIFKYYRDLVKELDLKMPIQDPIDYVGKFGDKVGIPQPTQRKAIEIISSAKEKNLVSGKHPHSIAAAALYLACILHSLPDKTQEKISEAANISEVTLRNRSKDFRENLKFTDQDRVRLERRFGRFPRVTTVSYEKKILNLIKK